MTGRRLPFWVVALAVLGLGAGMVWWIVTQSETSVMLPDGRQILLVGQTYGTNHWFHEGKSWVKVIRRYITPARAFQLGLRSYLHVSSETNLLLWTYWRFPATNQASLFASVCDWHGIESEPAPPAVFASVPHRREALVAWQFHNLPRRQKKVLLRFYERDPQYRPHRIGELEVGNAAYGRFPEWAASTPPVAVKQGELEFSLVELRSVEPVPEGLKIQRSYIAPWTTAAFAVRREGKEDPAWRLRKFEALGSTGNSFTIYMSPVQRRGSQLGLGFSNVLWPDEPAWKFRVEFSPEANFAPGETWTARSVPLRRGSATVLSNLKVSLQGTVLSNLEVRVLSPAELQPSLPPPRNTTLKLQFTPLVPGLRVDLVNAVDDRGRVLPHDDGFDFPPGTYETRVQAFPDSHSADLTFAVRQSHIVEFLVKPVYLTTNVASTFPAGAKSGTNAPR
jgi:hypothetical protein